MSFWLDDTGDNFAPPHGRVGLTNLSVTSLEIHRAAERTKVAHRLTNALGLVDTDTLMAAGYLERIVQGANTMS